MKDDSEQTLYPRSGETESIYELTRLMIVRSSNLATNILLKKVGAENANNFVHSLGIEGVTVRRGVEDNVAFLLGVNNSATARGLTQTMDLIARKKVVSEEASEMMIEILVGQEKIRGVYQPMGLAVSDDGQRLYVADRGWNLVFVFIRVHLSAVDSRPAVASREGRLAKVDSWLRFPR